jgi:hypothetical protein
MFDPLTGAAETANTRYEPSTFADWSEMGEDSIYGPISNFNTVVPSIPLPLIGKVKQLA